MDSPLIFTCPNGAGRVRLSDSGESVGVLRATTGGYIFTPRPTGVAHGFPQAVGVDLEGIRSTVLAMVGIVTAADRYLKLAESYGASGYHAKASAAYLCAANECGTLSERARHIGTAITHARKVTL